MGSAAMDGQTVEIIGRNYLVSMLVRDRLEVARPERDRGVDLIAYLDLEKTGGSLTACPIQLKATTRSSFSLFQKYTKFSLLLLAYVWHVQNPNEACAYALSYPEAFTVADQMGWTGTPSWVKAGYSTTNPSKKLMVLLEPYLMNPGDWKRKVEQVATDQSLALIIHATA